MKRHPVFIESGDKAPGQREAESAQPVQPEPEHDLGGGDICSLEQEASTDDDKPLD